MFESAGIAFAGPALYKPQALTSIYSNKKTKECNNETLYLSRSGVLSAPALSGTEFRITGRVVFYFENLSIFYC